MWGGWERMFQIVGTVNKDLGYVQGMLRIQFALNPGHIHEAGKTQLIQESKVGTARTLTALSPRRHRPLGATEVPEQGSDSV